MTTSLVATSIYHLMSGAALTLLYSMALEFYFGFGFTHKRAAMTGTSIAVFTVVMEYLGRAS